MNSHRLHEWLESYFIGRRDNLRSVLKFCIYQSIKFLVVFLSRQYYLSYAGFSGFHITFIDST